MQESSKIHVGLDVHKDSISVAAAEPGRASARLIGKVVPDVPKLPQAGAPSVAIRLRATRPVSDCACGCGYRHGGRCVSSRRRFNPRGVKRKMSNFNVRHRGEPLHQRYQPMPLLRI